MLNDTKLQEPSELFDLEVTREFYAAMETDELLLFVGTGGAGYEDVVLDVARAELRTRGVEDSELSVKVLEAKAQMYDKQVVQARETKAKPVNRSVFWACVLDPIGYSLWYVVYLAVKNRWQALRDVLWAVVLGFLLKALFVIAVVKFSSYLF